MSMITLYMRMNLPISCNHCALPAQVIFRSDVILLAGPIGLHLLLTRQIRLPRAIALSALWVAISLAATVLVDSVFWDRWLWPEGQVFVFNTWHNK